MAIYHFHFSSVQRSKGMCSIPYAAYIRGTSMTDERTGASYNFANKEDVAYSNILIPQNSPAWLKELVELTIPANLSEIQKLTLVRDHQNLVSEKLWNMSELKSLKCNARTANIIDLALPKELTLEQNIALLEGFVKETYTDKGMLADIAIHEDEENKNPHGHIILLNREINENGFGMVNEYWNTNAFLREQRQDWADKVNEYLELHGIDARIDHRSYKEQGIELEPTVHLGVGKYHEGKDRFYQNQEIKQINALRILENPGIAFDALAKAKTTFTRDDLADIALRYSEDDKQFHELMAAMGESKDLLEVGKVNGKTTYTARSMLLVNEEMVEAKAAASREAILNQHALARFAVLSGEDVLKETQKYYDEIAKTVIHNITTHNGLFNDLDIGKCLSQYNLSNEDYLNVAAKIKGSEDVIYMGTWIDGQDTYTTQALFNIDCEIQELTERLCNSQHLKVSNTVREELLKQYQDSLPENKKLNEKQYIAVSNVLQKDQAIDCIVGRAGTGKSYSLKAAQYVFEKLGSNIYGVALQGVAADRLSQDGINARTVESFKYAVTNKSIQLKKGDVLFVDEAGMMDSASMRDLLKIAYGYKLKIIPVGDPNQIDPVGSGAPFKYLLGRAGSKEITTVVRQQIEWQARATEQLSTFNLKEGLGAYDLKGYIKYGKPADVTMNGLVTDLLNHKANEGHSIAQYITLAHANAEVDQLNAAIRAERVNRGEIAEGYSVNVDVKRGSQKTIHIAQDDRIMFLENKSKLGVSNGSFGTVESVEFTEAGNVLHFTARLDEGKVVRIDPNEYNKFDLGYAATVHKSQAMTQDFVYAFDDKSGWVRNLLYVAASRHKWMFKLFSTQKDFDTLVDSMSRVSLKDSSLGFPWMFAQVRGFATEALNPQFKNQLLNKFVNAKETIVERFEYYFRPEAYEQRQIKRQEKLETEIANSRATYAEKIVERENARLVARYVETNRQLGKAWEAVRTKMAEFGITEFRYESKEFNLVAATSEYQSLEGITAVRDQLAAEISKNVSKYTKALEVYNLREAKLVDQAEKHHKRILVDAYVKEMAAGRMVQRDQLAEQICRDVKGHFIFLKARQVDMQGLYQQSHAHERRAFMTMLSPSELKGFRLVEEYRALNRELAIKMKTLPNSRGEITGEIGRYQEADILHLHGLVDKRNHVAHAICEHVEACDRSLEYFGIGSSSPKEVSNWLTTQHVQENADLRMLAILDAEKAQQLKNNFAVDEKTAQQRWYRLQQHSAQVVVAERVKAYQEAVINQDHEVRLETAYHIANEARFHHGVIVKGDRPVDEVWKEIRKDAKAYEFEQKLTGLSLDQQAAYRVVRDYIEARAECGKAWGEAFATKEMASDMEEKAFFASVMPIIRPLEIKRNVLADKVLANPDHYLDAMLDLKIDLQKVLEQSDQHNRSRLVKQYQETTLVLEQAKLAQKLCEDPEVFRKEVAVAGIQWRDIRKTAGVAERIEIFKEATTLEKRLIRDINSYKELNRQVGKTWSQILAKKEENKKVEVGSTKQYKADLMLAKRDAYAFKINEQMALLRIHQSLEGEVSSPKVSQHIFEVSKLDFAKIQKQAENHLARVEVVKEWEILWPKVSKSLTGISTARTVSELSRYEQDIFVPAMADMKGLVSKMKNPRQYIAAVREIGINFTEFVGQQAKLANMEQGFKELKEELAAVSNPYRLSKDDHKSIGRAQQIVRESLPAGGTIVERYLREERGIVGPLPASCRYHPEMYLAGKKVPAAIFVGQAVDGLGVTVVQAIHLDPDTNKKVDWIDFIDAGTGKVHKVPAKLTYGRFLPGSSIVINEGKDPYKVGIVEGPETGLSVADANPDLRVELVLGTSNLKKIRLANTVKEAIIFADYDGVGAESERLVQKAGEFYARKGVDVFKVIPEGRSGGKEDFNDVARKEGIDAVKAYSAAPKLIAKARTVKEIAREITGYAKDLTAEKEQVNLALREKAEQQLAAIEKDTSAFNTTQDGHEKYQKARNVYILITKVLRDPILSGYLQEHMPNEYNKIEKRYETIKEKQWDKTFRGEAAKAASNYVKNTFKKANEFNQTQDRPERYKIAKAVYTNIRLAYQDPLIKEHLEEKMPNEHIKLQEKLAQIFEHGLDKQFDQETVKEADKAIKARFNVAKAYLETTNLSEKSEELGKLYKVIQKAYNDPLVKMHLQDKVPHEYEKFEQNLQVIKKQGLHVEFEHAMQQQVLSKNKGFSL